MPGVSVACSIDKRSDQEINRLTRDYRTVEQQVVGDHEDGYRDKAPQRRVKPC